MTDNGIPCTFCGSVRSAVLESRPTNHSSLRRRRECISCRARFTTYESVGKNDSVHALVAMKRMRILMRKAIKISRESEREESAK